MTSAPTGSDATQFPSEAPPGGRHRIGIILPSFKDLRIIEAIESIRRFDDLGCVKIFVIDGGSGAEFVAAVRQHLSADDVLVSEPDKGIFDGLNKGLGMVDTPLVGWLGSDDLYSDTLKASDVVAKLQDHDIYVGSLYLCDGFQIKRKTSSWMAGKGLVSIGLHNPHYATFGRAELFCAHRFDHTALAADIGYFLAVFGSDPRVAYSNEVFVLQAMGGFSIQSKRKVLKVNRNAFDFYRRDSNIIQASLAIGLKLGYKVLGSLHYRLRPRSWEREFPQSATILSQGRGSGLQ